MSDSDITGDLPTNKRDLMCHQELNRCMADPWMQVSDKLPGHTCLNNYECRSQKCANTNGLYLCQGSVANETCSADEDCSPGLYCSKSRGICRTQLGEGKKCTRDFDCQNNLACANKVCIKYGKNFNGQDSDNPPSCMGGHAEKIYQMEGKYLPPKCFKAPMLVENFETNEPRTNMTCESIDSHCHYLSTSPTD